MSGRKASKLKRAGIQAITEPKTVGTGTQGDKAAAGQANGHDAGTHEAVGYEVVSQNSARPSAVSDAVLRPSQSVHWREPAWAGLVLVVTVVLAAVASVNDYTALKAIVGPGWYCWLVLSVICVLGVVLVFRWRRRGVDVPLYFRIVLLIGATCGVFTCWSAVKVITEAKATTPSAPTGAHLDLRNQDVHDVSFAERNLRNSDFSGATLRRVDLSEADLSESDLRNAVLDEVDLSGVDLCGVDLRGTNLRKANGLGSITDWSYVFYNKRTKLPPGQSYIFNTLPGPIPDSGHDLLYMCKSNVTRRLGG
jgi:hypothetical protein